MFQLRWLKRFIRRNTRKIPEQKAINWQRRLSVIYMICTWNAFGAVLYMCFTGRHDWMKAGGFAPDVDIPAGRSWAHILGVKNAQVISISGFKVVGTYEIKEDDEFDYGNAVSKEAEKVAEDGEMVSE